MVEALLQRYSTLNTDAATARAAHDKKAPLSVRAQKLAEITTFWTRAGIYEKLASDVDNTDDVAAVLEWLNARRLQLTDEGKKQRIDAYTAVLVDEIEHARDLLAAAGD